MSSGFIFIAELKHCDDAIRYSLMNKLSKFTDVIISKQDGEHKYLIVIDKYRNWYLPVDIYNTVLNSDTLVVWDNICRYTYLDNILGGIDINELKKQPDGAEIFIAMWLDYRYLINDWDDICERIRNNNSYNVNSPMPSPYNSSGQYDQQNMNCPPMFRQPIPTFMNNKHVDKTDSSELTIKNKDKQISIRKITIL